MRHRSDRRLVHLADSVYFFGFTNAAEDMATKRLELLATARRDGGKLGRKKYRSPQRFAERFDPRGLVHCAADDREVEPVDGADIPVEHFADMQRQIDNCSGKARRRAPPV